MSGRFDRTGLRRHPTTTSTTVRIQNLFAGTQASISLISRCALPDLPVSHNPELVFCNLVIPWAACCPRSQR